MPHQTTTETTAPVIDHARFAAARQDKGLSQSEVARRAGCAPSAVSKFEAGRGGSPALVARLCEVVGLSVTDLMDIDAPLPQLYTPEEAEPILKTPASTLRRKAGARVIPCTRIGREVLFSVRDLRDIVTMHRRPALPDP